jgi:hypothetical protein
VKTRLDNFIGQVAQGIIIGRPREGHNAAIVGRNRGLIEADIAEIVAELAVAVDRFILLQEADAVLGDKNAAGFRQRLQPS